MATTAKKLDELLRELCEEVGLDLSHPAADAGIFTIDGVLVAVGESEDESQLDIRVVLETGYGILNDVMLLRQLVFQTYEVQDDAFPIRFGVASETGELVAMMLVPSAEVGTGAELLRMLEMACELAQNEFAELCALAAAELARENAAEDSDLGPEPAPAWARDAIPA